VNHSQETAPTPDRRRVLCAAGAAVGSLLAGPLVRTACPAESADPAEPTVREGPCGVLQDGDTVELQGEACQIVEEAYRLGHEYEKRHGGCAQCTVAALQDAVPFVPKDVGLFRGASCLDGGATPTGVQNCGSFTGSGMVIGYVCGRTRSETFEGSGALSHKLVRKLYERYAEAYGSVLCKDVREAAERDCPKVVGQAARWTAEILQEQFTEP
jgi:hypothetical protein